MRNSPTADQNTFYRFRYIHEQMSSPTSQIVVHHIMCVTRVCRPPHPNGILSSTIQTGWALFSINTTLTAIHMHLISQFACKQSTFQSVRGHDLRIKSRSGDGSRHLGMWWTIVLHISWSTVLMANSISLLGNNLYHLTLLYWLVSVFFCITLTHWGRATHICVSKLTITGSDNGLSPGRRQAINWTNDGILLIRTLGTNFSEILSEIHAFSFQENALENVVCEMASIQFCLGLNVLKYQIVTWEMHCWARYMCVSGCEHTSHIYILIVFSMCL